MPIDVLLTRNVEQVARQVEALQAAQGDRWIMDRDACKSARPAPAMKRSKLKRLALI